ncbi:polysaccharide deacetylase family protein [Peptoniphilus catoniae]|uniref:polysaccharide deacetylase family protein n=1 Tax=Peptoniphilus catoniae TaxID=1660341 RepID=UPI0015D65219|nr:polysaccharide deacetylase family protein [Peptoniphilus catoniae]
MNSDNNFNKQTKKAPESTRLQRKKRMQKRRRRMRRRRILAGLLLLLIVFGISKAIKGFINKPKTISIEGSLPAWYFGLAYDNLNGINYKPPKEYLNPKDQSLEVYDKATTIVKTLVPGSNHITMADDYAYDTKTIRSYIRGEAEYEGKDKLVFLTFDDGPNNYVTPKILSILEKNNVHATFFVVGKDVNEHHEDILKKTVLKGNSIALHSFSHVYEDLYPEKKADPDKIIEEAKLSQGRLKNIFGEDFSSNVWRYPGGHMSWDNTVKSDEILKQNGIEWIDWNCMTGDAEPESRRPSSPEEFVTYVDRTLNKNVHNEVAVVLMHDAKNKDHTVDALQSIIDYFKDKDYKFCILK